MKTSANRKVFKSPSGEYYSERTITVQTPYGWVTTPTVDADGREWSEDSMTAFLNKYGPIDFVTGDRLPTFETLSEALDYAKQRTDSYSDQLDGMLFKGLLGTEMEMSNTTESLLD
jgi:hypothetical protein